LTADSECVLFNDDMDMFASLTAISDLTNRLQVMRNDSIPAFRQLYEAAFATYVVRLQSALLCQRQVTDNTNEENKHLITCKDNL